MLKSYSFKNYKAFDSGRIQLKPITILVGANNVGKTSLLELLLIMQQTAVDPSSSYRSALKLNGRFVSTGVPALLFRDGNVRRHLTFGFEFKNSRLLALLSRDLHTEYVQILTMAIEALYRMLAESEQVDKLESNIEERLANWHKQLESRRKAKLFRRSVRDGFFDDVIAGLEQYRRALKDVVTDSGKREERRRRFYRDFHGVYQGDPLFGWDSSDMKSVMQFINDCEDIRGSTFEIEYVLGFCRGTGLLFVRSVKLKSSGLDVLSIKLKDRGKTITSITSSLREMRDYSQYARVVTRGLRSDATIFTLFDERPKTNNRFFALTARRVMEIAISGLADEFAIAKIGHVSPLRAYPKRFYLLDAAGGGVSGGDALVEVLSENHKLKALVNRWLSLFGIKLDVAQFESLIYRLRVTQPGLSLELDMTDVGFGVSQVLPVFVKALLSEKSSITLIEQPEIHLHPRMQAQLADFFIEVCEKTSDRTRTFIIETHSAYFLNRIRRRLAEGAVTPDDVAIYSVHEKSASDTPKLESIRIPTNGDFAWPKEFYSTDLEDTIYFLSQQQE